jgi:hypothetical protein
MRPKEQGDGGQRDLFRSRLDQIVNLEQALAKLSKAIDWGFVEQQFGAVYDDLSMRQVKRSCDWDNCEGQYITRGRTYAARLTPYLVPSSVRSSW